jgi:hypothetical protein
MKQTATDFEQFRESLYQENLRGAWELESMKYGIMARLGLDEPGALELACKIVASDKQPKGDKTMTFNLQELFAGLDDDEIAKVLEGLTFEEQAQLFRSMSSKVDPRFAPPTNEEILESNAKALKFMFKEPSKYRDQIAAIALENDAIWHAQDATARAAKEAEQPDAHIAALEGQRDAMLEEWARYSKFPSRYKARMAELTTQLQAVERKILEAKA